MINVGDRVRVVSGALMGLEGTITHIWREGSFEVTMDTRAFCREQGFDEGSEHDTLWYADDEIELVEEAN